VHDVYVSAVVHAVHIIWIARNAFCFGNIKYSSYSARNSIIASVSLSGSLSTGNCIPYDTSQLDNFCIPPSFRRFKGLILAMEYATTFHWHRL
jgi:hypothetical protein